MQMKPVARTMSAIHPGTHLLYLPILILILLYLLMSCILSTPFPVTTIVFNFVCCLTCLLTNTNTGISRIFFFFFLSSYAEDSTTPLLLSHTHWHATPPTQALKVKKQGIHSAKNELCAADDVHFVAILQYQPITTENHEHISTILWTASFPHSTNN